MTNMGFAALSGKFDLTLAFAQTFALSITQACIAFRA
jgi:hypothetical protein